MDLLAGGVGAAGVEEEEDDAVDTVDFPVVVTAGSRVGRGMAGLLLAGETEGTGIVVEEGPG